MFKIYYNCIKCFHISRFFKYLLKMQKFGRRFFIFSGALFTGMIFAFMWRKYEEFNLNLTLYKFMPKPNNFEYLYNIWLEKEGFQRLHQDGEDDFPDAVKARSWIKEDKYLYEQVRVLCVVITKELKQAKAVKNTWINHCNVAVFYGSYEDEVIPVARLPNTKPWPLLCGGLLRAWKHYHKDFDWILVVDDNTYTIAENLRYLVAPLSSLHIHYLGHSLRDHNTGIRYNSAKAGYAISHQLMKIFSQTLPDDDACDKFLHVCATEDCILGKLLSEMGAIPMDTRDNLGRGRFNAFSVQELLIPNSISMFNDYWKDSIYVSQQGENCCSDFAVTFHKINPNKMYLLEYTVYHLKVFHGKTMAEPAIKSNLMQSNHSSTFTENKLNSDVGISSASISSSQKKINVKT